jgi:hypothetical protein
MPQLSNCAADAPVKTQHLSLVRGLLKAHLPQANRGKGEQTVMRTNTRLRGAFLVSIALAAGIAGASGCRKKTPAEKVGDKIENAGDKIEDKIDEAN